MLGHLGHGVAQPARVLLADQHRHPQSARPLDEHGGVVRDLLEAVDRLAKTLLDVDHQQRGSRAVKHGGRAHAALSANARSR